AAAAALIHAELSDRFGSQSVFLDYESITLGHDFAPELLARVRASAVLLVVVGDRWLDGEVGQRPIDDPNDWVHMEIVEAQTYDVPVVPVLFGGAQLVQERLPDALAMLGNLQHIEIRNRRQRTDIELLGRDLERQIPRLGEHMRKHSIGAAPEDAYAFGLALRSPITVDKPEGPPLLRLYVRRAQLRRGLGLSTQ